MEENKLYILGNAGHEHDWVKERIVNSSQRVFFVTSDNQIMGTMTSRTPRKLKKAQKKLGIYSPPHMVGFDIELLQNGE